MKNEICAICNKEITGALTSYGKGAYAHCHCYEINHPPITPTSFYQVARGCGDPVLAAEVIAKMVPDELGKAIVQEFNLRLIQQWRRRCEPR